jgi:fructose-bisphosphate aldolase class II
MSLVASKQILTEAQDKKYAVGAFNINNMEILQSVIEAAVEKHSPALIQVTEGAVKYAGLNYLVAMVKTATSKLDIPFALHLDHGKSLKMIKKCIEFGFTSVMIDGSHLPFEENIATTKEVVDLAHSKGISVEAELGRLAGIEDNVSVDEKEAILTDPDEARMFVEKTKIDALAIAVGTSHGAYKFKGEVKLALDRIKTIKQLTGIPLVLHGASSVDPETVEKALKYGAKLPGAKGVPPQSIKQAISNGISKINIDTDLRLAFTAAVRKILTTSPEIFDPRKIIGPAREAIKKIVKDKMDLFGSSGRA